MADAHCRIYQEDRICLSLGELISDTTISKTIITDRLPLLHTDTIITDTIRPSRMFYQYFYQ